MRRTQLVQAYSGQRTRLSSRTAENWRISERHPTQEEHEYTATLRYQVAACVCFDMNATLEIPVEVAAAVAAALLASTCFVFAIPVLSRHWKAFVSSPPIVFFHVERVTVNVSLQAASAFIRDVRNLPVYEQKVCGARVVREFQVCPDDHGSAHLSTVNKDQDLADVDANGKSISRNTDVKTGLDYTLQGGWCGFPWTASFSMTHTKNGGFHSKVTPLRPGYRGITASLLDIVGGFSLQPIAIIDEKNPDNNEQRIATRVTHYERYGWPGAYVLLRVPSVRKFVAKWHSDGMRIEMQAIRIAMEDAAKRKQSTPSEQLMKLLKESHLTFARFVRQEVTGVSYELPSIPNSVVA